ncbi:helix-turn-helix domain-containing protein [Amycolatopsis sp. NPDC051371]|uniref:TetR/AcrR family transcriptional regulator n=1 Tax=Amycolatopsis sp. NPDC051371 TaxID=3155800 RepID=UPI00341DCC50
MTGDSDGRRTNTRQRIREVALELFAERGYDQTTLRGIADQLGVTQAAVYYHYRTKEDILTSLLDDLIEGMDKIIEWGPTLEPGPERRLGVLERYSALLAATFEKAPQLIRFLQESQTSIKDMAAGAGIRERFQGLKALLVDPAADIEEQLSAQLALLALHLGTFALDEVDADRGARGAAALRVAMRLAGAEHPAGRSRG